MSRKRTRRKVYALVNPITHALMGAAITDTASIDKLRMVELSAIEAFRTGKANQHDWMALADMLNMSETMTNDGIGPEAEESCQAGQRALANAHERHFRKGMPIGFTGPELQDIRAAYEFHDLQRQSISRSRYEQAIKKTGDRIRSSHPNLRICIAKETA